MDIVERSANILNYFTFVGSLAKYQGWDKISPDSRRLKYQKEDPKVLVDNVFPIFSCFLGVWIASNGEVSAFGRPEWCSS